MRQLIGLRELSNTTAKGCAPNCTVSCVHQISYMDFWRAPQTLQPQPRTPEVGELIQIQSN